MELRQPPSHFDAQELSKSNLGDAAIALGIQRRFSKIFPILGIDAFHQSLGQDSDAIATSVAATFDDRTCQKIDQGAKRHMGPGKLLGNDGQRDSRGLADAKGEVPGFSSHGGDEIPAGGGGRVHLQILDDPHPYVTRGLKSKGGNSIGKRQVVVDGLGNVNEQDATTGSIGQSHRR